MRTDMSCNCHINTGKTTFPEQMPIGMSYVPWQKWQAVYEAEKALHYGTIFQELYKPFLGKGGCRS